MDKNKSNFRKKMPEPTIEMLTDEQMCRTKGEKEYRDFVKYEARHKAKKSKRERQIQENEDSGKAHYVYRNEHIYQYPYGIEVSTSAPERQPVRPVDDATVEKTVERMVPNTADMVRVHRLTGMRPCELCAMRWFRLPSSPPLEKVRSALHL